ncbi:MAG: alpha/beta hydrolase [Deltaproteobacteria bacterium]|nr:alpha/beta hydrolase [Deltaproteobacteria bacterium]
MNATDEKFVDVNGIRTRYFEKGSGENLVLIHGGVFGSNDAADCGLDWGLNFDALARWFHVYALDKLGQGLTDNPPSDDDYTMAATVRHAIGFIEALKLGGVHVVGHSRGAYVAARMTLERPDLVRSCIPVDTNTLAPGMGRNHIVFADAPEPRLTRESQRWVIERYSYSGAHITEDWLDSMTEIAQLPKYQETVDRMVTRGLRKSLFLTKHSLQKEETLGWIRDRGLQRPTLLVWGYNDPTATLAQGLRLFELLAMRERRSQMHIINRAGHFSYREHPREFNEVVRGFIAAQGR